MNATGGGGGYGLPFKREPLAVANDVRYGFVSEEAARNDYCVAVTQDFHVDEAATAALRA
ncbi:MAG: hypothetical protein ABIX44_00330 [Cryobacterium sp.]